MRIVPYTNAVGSLIYLMVCSRPDIAYATSIISRFMSNPGKRHWAAVKWVLRYIKGTVNTCLTYRKSKDETYILQGYVDADFAGDLDNEDLSRFISS